MIAVLLVGLLVSLFAAIRGGSHWIEREVARSPLPPVWAEVIRVTLNGGETLYLDRQAVARVRSEARRARR